MGSGSLPTALAALASLALVSMSILEVSVAAPEQVHIQLTRWEDEMLVYWMTPQETNTSTVQYGVEPDALDSLAWSYVQGQYVFKREYASGYFHKVILRKLQPGTRYYYRVGEDADGWSETFWFTTRENDNDATIRIATLADQDMTEDSDNVLQGLLRQQMNFNYDMLLHAGDIVYADGEQSKWDDYGRWWEPFAAHYPVMYTIGENDVEGQATDAYSNRLRHGVTPTTESWNWGEYWYSFRYGPAHIVFLSSEHFSTATWITRDPQDQIDWLERNLRAANTPENRRVRPWIIVVIHRPLLNSPPEKLAQGPLDQDLKSAFEELFHTYRVNVVISGHCHNYERTYPVYKEEVTEWSRGWEESPYTMDVYSNSASGNWGTIYTTVGTAGRPVEHVGNRPSELDAPCIVKHTNGVETESFIERESECSNGCFSKDWSVAMNADRGFGVIEANRTVLHFKYFSVEQDRVIDEFVVCAVPGCGSAPLVSPATWPGATGDADKIDEQHILPPPRPPLPPMAPPTPPSPIDLEEEVAEEEEEPDRDQDGMIIGALPGDEGYEMPGNTSAESSPTQQPEAQDVQDMQGIQDVQDVPEDSPMLDSSFLSPEPEGRDSFMSVAEPAAGYAPASPVQGAGGDAAAHAEPTPRDVAAELEKLRLSKAEEAAAGSSSSQSLPFALIVGIVALCFACCLGVVAGVVLSVLRRRALMDAEQATATAGSDNMMATGPGGCEMGNLDMGNLPAAGFGGSSEWSAAMQKKGLGQPPKQAI